MEKSPHTYTNRNKSLEPISHKISKDDFHSGANENTVHVKPVLYLTTLR